MILDTNALSAIAEGEAGAVKQFGQIRQPALPVIVLGEFRFGVAQSRQRAEYERWLGEIVSVCRVIEVGEETAARYADVRLELKRAGTPIPANDLWIAAMCRQHGLAILSRDEHFDLVKGVHRLTW